MLDAVYVDLDGTLLGPGGALFRDIDEQFSLLAARAVEACDRAGAELVVMTGRRQAQAKEVARLLGQPAFVFEAGAGVVLDGEEHWMTAPLLPHDGPRGSVHDQIEDAGAVRLLLDAYPDRLEYHDPWHHDRAVSHLLRGLVDADAATELLAAHGHEALRLLDNGPVRRRSERLAGLDQVRAYHLVPKGVSKAAAVAFHVRARGYDPARCIAVGDSREDLQCAAAVGAFWLVRNGLTKDPTIGAALARLPNAKVAEGAHGAGVYEAVVETLARRGG